MYKLIEEKIKKYVINGNNVKEITQTFFDEKTGAKKQIIKTKTYERIGNPDLGQCVFNECDILKAMARRGGYM